MNSRVSGGRARESLEQEGLLIGLTKEQKRRKQKRKKRRRRRSHCHSSTPPAVAVASAVGPVPPLELLLLRLPLFWLLSVRQRRLTGLERKRLGTRLKRKKRKKKKKCWGEEV
jgi:hypothetical protein